MTPAAVPAPWSRLPREARDTLFLIAVVAWTVLPHLGHLPVWCGVMTGVLLAWRANLAVGGRPLPPRWVLVLILAGAAGLTWWSHRTLLGKEAGVTLAVTLMALKTLELRARRDAFVVFFLGFFLVLTHFLYSQTLAVAGAMLISVWGLLTALVLAHMPAGQPQLRQAGLLALRTAALGAPIMALLFVLFPRVGPLWGLPQDAMGATGLSNSMRMGSLAEVAADDSIAMRVRFLDRVPPPSQRYFRGPVLSRFDGQEWQADAPDELPSNTGLASSRTVVHYEATIEPLRIATLPLLETAVAVSAVEGLRFARSRDGQWLANRPITERLRVEVTSRTGEGAPTADALALRRLTQLPPGSNPRTRAWARALRASPALAEADASALAAAVLAHVRQENYRYTLSPGAYGEADPYRAVDEFWLDRRLGFCEHFASAFVVVMREMGVPARVVTGYQGTDSTPVDGYYVVRQSSAHAWAEYWQAGRGWVRADPTAAVAPDRIDRSRRLSPPPGALAGAIGAVSPTLLLQLRTGIEAINNRWNQWVLSYSRGSQIELLGSLGLRSTSWEDIALLLIGVLSGLALLGAAWAWWDRHRVDPWARQMAALRALLQRLGVAAEAHDPPRTLARKARAALGDRAAPLVAELDALDAMRYAPGASRRPDPALTRRFAAAARALLANRA